MAGALDEDTAKTLVSGRQTVMSVLGTAQDKLKRIFLVFVVFFMLAFYSLRAFVWDRLKADLVYNRMSAEITRQTDIVVTDPFNVILLQAKIGLAVGILGALPAVVWYGRSGLKRRGFWPSGTVPRWKLAAFGLATVVLFTGGVAYAYFVFFPVMFEFLATIAINSGFNPTWSIVMWTDFVFFLALSFGLAAQLPLAMSAAARTGVVPYETFRDKWRYAVVGIFVFGAFFSPPDPFTQLMWGVPLVALYFISLGVTKLAVLSQRAGQQVSTPAVARERWNLLAGTAVAAGLGVFLFLLEGGLAATNDALAWAGSARRVPAADGLGAFGLAPGVVAGALAAAAGLFAAGIALFYLRIVELERLTGADDAEESEEPSLDLAEMDAAAVRDLGADRFAAIEEDRALAQAQQAVDADRPATARAILDRLDERDAADGSEDSPDEAGEGGPGDEGEAEAEEQDSGLLAETTAGIVDPFTEEETTEDDIGGYYYDIAFILDSLTSKAFWVVGTFMLVLAGTFTFLYQGGIETVVDAFLRNLPAEMAEDVDLVVLHPVEELIFMIKFSTLLAGLSVMPMLAYFAWPAIERRGLATGDRSVLLAWGGTLAVALLGGSLLGFLLVGPTVISALARDVLTSNMVIAYRINNFGWLVIYLTVGIGLLAMIPATMVLFHHGSIVSYRRMYRSWRGVVLAIFAVAGLASPAGIFTMFLVAIPASLAYGLGLGLLWAYDRIGRAVPRGRRETAD